MQELNFKEQVLFISPKLHCRGHINLPLDVVHVVEVVIISVTSNRDINPGAQSKLHLLEYPVTIAL